MIHLQVHEVLNLKWEKLNPDGTQHHLIVDTTRGRYVFAFFNHRGKHEPTEAEPDAA